MFQPQSVGLGEPEANIEVYIANRPPLMWYQELTGMHPLQQGEIADICQKTGNHWRKIFNVYAKFLFELEPNHRQSFASWQAFRDAMLLAKDATHSLLFSPLSRLNTDSPQAQHRRAPVRIVMGKQYGSLLTQQAQVDIVWLDDFFAIAQDERVIVCPYFDYRQLSNIKITQLCELINTQFFNEAPHSID